jgi:hypothetical protein
MRTSWCSLAQSAGGLRPFGEGPRRSSGKSSRRIPPWVILGLILGISPICQVPAQAPRLPAARSFRIEGNKTFSEDQVRRGLELHIDYHLAAHRQAPESEFAPTIRTLIRDGYLRAGFPDIQVTTAAGDAAKGETDVRIQEGEQYRCGKIEFAGTGLASEAVRADLTKALIEETKNSGDSSTPIPPLWEPGSPAPFDEQAKAVMLTILQAKLNEHGFFQPKLEVHLEPDKATHNVSLQIKMLNEGIKGTIEEFRLNYAGPAKNSEAQLLKFLHLEKGMPLRANLVTEITNQLWTCGRFLQHDVLLEPLTQPGAFRLHLIMEDLKEAPPLTQQLSPQAEVLLKCREWLSGLNQQSYDLLSDMRMVGTNGQRYQFNLGLSKAGIAVSVDGGATNQPGQLVYGVTVTTQSMLHFSAWRNEKLTVPGLSNQLAAVFDVSPVTAADRSARFNLSVGMKFSSRTDGEPLSVQFNLAPCAFLSMVGERSRLEIHGGILEGMISSDREETPTRVKIEVATGRLLELELSQMTNGVGFHYTMHTEENGFAKLMAKINSGTAGFSEQFNSEYPLSSWLGFMMTDFLESPLAQKFFDSKGTEKRRNFRVALAALKTALGKKDLAHCLYPLESGFANLFSLWPTNQESEASFFVPPRPDLENPQAGIIAWLAPFALMGIDKAWAPGSWPWTVCREAVFTVSNRGKYTSAELQTLLGSDELGPLGGGLIATILSALDANLADKFARRSLQQLTPEKVQLDLRFLLAPESSAGRLLGDTLRLLAGVRDQDLVMFTSSIGIVSTNGLIAGKHLLESDTNVPPAKILAPLVLEQWDPWLHLFLGGFLTNLAQKVGTPTTPEDAFARAKFLKEHIQNPDDEKEALKYLVMSANQGLPKAELLLGSLYESGEAGEKDMSKALALYRKAAEAHEPHAGCRIADMYREGRGVPQDQEEMAKWLRGDAEQGCAGAQYKLAIYAELNNDIPQALDWFRRAGTNCAPQAQSALGDRLSEGFSVPRNDAEAYMWYTLASRAGDRPAGASARLLRAKLTQEQIAEAETEADAIQESHSPGEQRRRMQVETQRIQNQIRSQLTR